MRTPKLTRRQALQRSGALLLSLGAAELAHGATIVAVRVWPASEYTRVTIESDQVLPAKHFLAENPPRLVIDIEQLNLNPALRELVGKVRSDDPFIAGVRVGQYAPHVVRLVVDLKQPVQPQQFTLTPIAAYQHRLVFDLFPSQPVDPLLALARDKRSNADKLASEQQAARSVQDALGEFIGKVEKPGSAPSGGAPPQGSTAARPPAAELPGPAAPRTERLIIVALDPGHGGEDPGAVGPTGLREKDVVLQMALQLRERLSALPNMRVMMTREADFFVPLQERVRKARRVQADLFVSIHADAYLRPDARGASVFALSEGGATSSTARWLAGKENAADLVGGVNLQVKDRQLMRAMLDMSTTAQIKDSLKLGQEVLGGLKRVGRLHKRSVEQAGFAVLKAPDVPSILVETAFISNPEEEELLRDPDYQARLVEALATGIRRYFSKNPPLARQRQI